MHIADKQLDEYIALYQSEYGGHLERTEALEQLHKLINLVLYMVLPENQVLDLETSLEKEYSENAMLKYNEG